MKKQNKKATPEAKADQLTVGSAVLSPSFRSVWCNAISIQGGSYGFDIICGSFLDGGKDGTRYPFMEVSVGLSPECAAKLHELLGEQLKEFRNRFGPICGDENA